jgi:hypothetical protein
MALLNMPTPNKDQLAHLISCDHLTCRSVRTVISVSKFCFDVVPIHNLFCVLSAITLPRIKIEASLRSTDS